MRPRAAVAGALAGALALVLAGCAGGQTEHHTITAALVQGKAGFDPATVTVHHGDTVDFTVLNTTDKTHGFSIQGYGITKLSDPSAGPLHVRFTAGKAGTYKIFCQLHPTHQTATLTVV
ncbi:MAG: cupredoxin domain-containing protein [Acidimicrobiales bacterium]